VARGQQAGGSDSWRIIRSVGVPPAMPVFLPAFFEERRHRRRRGSL